MSDPQTKRTPNSVFSFSLEDEKSYSVTEFVDIAQTKLGKVLRERFNGLTPKQSIKVMTDRLNFACPYCGDSHENPYKKRGNLYFEGFNFHCFNCHEHTSFESLLKDFDEKVTHNELSFLIDQHEKHAIESSVSKVNSQVFLDSSSVDMWAIDRNELIKVMGFQEIKGSSIEKYLLKRNQKRFHKFAWNPNTQKLALFNLNPDNTKVIGMQLRNFDKSKKGEPKYLTFKLSKIYEDILKYESLPQDSRFQYADEISTVFELLHIDISKDIYVFEGPMDAFLLKNAVALCTAGRDFPFNLPVKWIFDDDKTGQRESIKRIKQGQPVFLWKKYIEEIHIKIHNKYKTDFNDLVNIAKSQNIKLPSIKKYFSTDKYDLYYL